jgi:serine/threonine protein kinase
MQDELEPWLQKLLLSKGRPIKESPAKLVTVHELAGKSFFVKRYRHSSVRFRPLKFFLKRSQAAREWRLARQLETLQIPIVRHLALGERWGLSGLKESILITEGFAGRPLNEVSGFDREALLQFLDQLHSRGIVHPDLHPGNILVNSDSGALRLVDLHGTRIGRALTASEWASNLALVRDYLPPQAAAKIHDLAAGIRKRSLARRCNRRLHLTLPGIRLAQQEPRRCALRPKSRSLFEAPLSRGKVLAHQRRLPLFHSSPKLRPVGGSGKQEQAQPHEDALSIAAIRRCSHQLAGGMPEPPKQSHQDCHSW